MSELKDYMVPKIIGHVLIRDKKTGHIILDQSDSQSIGHKILDPNKLFNDTTKKTNKP